MTRVSDIKIECKESLVRNEAAERLSTLASALAKGGDVTLALDGFTIPLRVPDDVRTEFELAVDAAGAPAVQRSNRARSAATPQSTNRR
jgi:amphi-Trp domain-containing protein